MEEKKKTNEKEVAMVECPFCNKPIEAPAKADVIFECPHCHKELITYEKCQELKQKIEKITKTDKANNQTLKWGGIAAFASLILLYAYFKTTAKDSPQNSYIEKTEKHTTSIDLPQKTKQQTEKQQEPAKNREKESQYQEMATWTGRTYSNDKCSYTLLKQADGTLYLKENNTNNYFNCSKQTIKNSTDYYFVDPDIADINVNLACFNLKKGTTVYIIHNFDYSSAEKKYMDGILVPFADNSARIYLDFLINGTAYYYNNGNPPISRLNEYGVLEYYNSDGSNEPAYECYAKLY
ncbi:hypothetical protein [Bacteroides fluxus]